MSDLMEKTALLLEVAEGRRKHESLSEAALYALVSGDTHMADFLASRIQERNALVMELVEINEREGGILPGVPPENSLESFLAVERLAATQPGLHPILDRIAALDKLRYFVTDAGSGCAVC